MKLSITAIALTVGIFAPALFAAPATAVQGDYYACETQYAIAISSAGVENIDQVAFEFYWGENQLEISEGWLLSEYEHFFPYSYNERDAFSIHSVWGMINYDAPAGVMTVYVPRANEMYSYWATCKLRDR